MNKLQFLAELKSNIHMLEDEEQTDILDEYSQHVDMKVAAGMTEKEAIAEFGPIDELIEEILAAYHVKVPEKKTHPIADGAHSIAEGSKSVAEAAVGATKKGYSKLKDAAAGAVDKIGRKAEAASDPAGDDLNGTAGVSADAGAGGTGAGAGASARPKAGWLSGLFGGLTRGTSSLWDSCVNLVKTCIRWCWNAFVACVALTMLCTAVLALFGFGFCVVLMLQGYPLIGVTIALLGGTVALTFATLLMVRLFVMKKVSAPNAGFAASSEARPADPVIPDARAATQPLPYLPANEVI